MIRSPFAKLVLAVLGGILGVALMLGILSVVNGGKGFVCCTGTTGIGWVVPLIGGLVIGAVSLALLGSEKDEQPPDEIGLRSSSCPSCGSSILDEWRLCPHCGQLLECQVQVAGAMRATPSA